MTSYSSSFPILEAVYALARFPAVGTLVVAKRVRLRMQLPTVQLRASLAPSAGSLRQHRYPTNAPRPLPTNAGGERVRHPPLTARSRAGNMCARTCGPLPLPERRYSPPCRRRPVKSIAFQRERNTLINGRRKKKQMRQVLESF